MIFYRTILLVLLLQVVPSLEAEEHHSHISTCDWLDSKPGNVFSKPKDPWLQDITFNTRFHWQYARVHGKSETLGGTNDFSYDNRGEIRRFYFGPTIRFLNAFTLKADANMAGDDKFRGEDRDLGYDSMFELYLTADLKKFIDPPFLDALALSYGKYEQRFTEEHMTSSREIYTPERSMLDAWILPGVPLPSNPTGLWFEAKNGPHTLAAGIFSTNHNTVLSSWDDGRAYWITYRHDLAPRTGMDMTELSANFIWNDTDDLDEQALNYDWAGTLWGRIGDGLWGLRGSLICGKNRLNTTEQGGYFAGIDFLQTYWLVQDRLMFTMRGEYARATEAEGMRLSSRYARAAGEATNEDIPTLASGRGDRHHSLYTGLNYHYCESLANKVMVGVEWERMDNSNANLTAYDGLTWWLGFRTAF